MNYKQAAETIRNVIRAPRADFARDALKDLAESLESQAANDASRDEKYQALQDIGKSAAESIAEMVAALECDYERLEELRGMAADLGSVDYTEEEKTELAADLAELEKAAGDCESREDAEQRIHEDPLSIEVRSGWYAPGEGNDGEHFGNGVKPEEFCILLSTGGPATRIIGELNEHCEPTRARLQVQDWFTQWTDYTGDAVSQDDLLTYCRCFYFGE